MVVMIGNSFADEPYRHPSADGWAARNKRGTFKHKCKWTGSWWQERNKPTLKRGAYKRHRSGARVTLRRNAIPY